MQIDITLSNNEILAAIGDYIVANGASVQGKNLSISIKAGRGGNGASAVVAITDAEEVAEMVKMPDALSEVGGDGSALFGNDED